MLLTGIGVVVAIALLLVVYGYYSDRIAGRDDVVFQIGDRTYTYAYLESRVESDVAQGRFDVNDVGNSITATIARIQREELTRLIGAERGISVTQADIDAGIRRDLNLDAEISNNELGPILARRLTRDDLSYKEYESIVKSQVIEDKLRDEFRAELPAETEQVDLLFIDAGSQAAALQAKAALDEGTEFADVAAQFSTHSSAGGGGELGWTPREAMDPELADVAFRISGRSDIVETEMSFYIIEVRGKEVREIDVAVQEEYARDQFNALLEAAFDDTPFIYALTGDQLVDIANAVGGSFG